MPKLITSTGKGFAGDVGSLLMDTATNAIGAAPYGDTIK